MTKRVPFPQKEKMIVSENEIKLTSMIEESGNKEYDDKNENVTDTSLDITNREKEHAHI